MTKTVEIVLVDGESTNEELERLTIDVKDLDSYDIGWAYKHQHEYAKWSGWVLGSDYDSDGIGGGLIVLKFQCFT